MLLLAGWGIYSKWSTVPSATTGRDQTRSTSDLANRSDNSRTDIGIPQNAGTSSSDVGHNTPGITKGQDPMDYGKTPGVKSNANEQVKSAVTAKLSNRNPERLSILLSPKPFNAEVYRNNSADYLSTVEPGRVFQPAAPGAKTLQIKALSPNFQRMEQGQSRRLMVQAVPHMPVTWTSTSLGQFSNKLTSITVEADAQGIAETTFVATSGTIEDVYILCASPVASGQLKFVVNVSKPGAKM